MNDVTVIRYPKRSLVTDHRPNSLDWDHCNPVAINAYDPTGIPNAGNQGRFG
jgi:hypothetical protein